MNEILQQAIDGGYNPNGEDIMWTPNLINANYFGQPTYLLQAHFWIALGKVRNWQFEKNTTRILILVMVLITRFSNIKGVISGAIGEIGCSIGMNSLNTLLKVMSR